MPIVTVVICTYRRTDLLEDCLRSLARQTAPPDTFTVLVVDNYGEEDCKRIATDLGARYVYEPQPGLSHARNRAARETTTDWAFFLDDDARAHPDMLEVFLRYAEDRNVRVLGGRYEHFFSSPPPAWVRHYYRRAVRASSRPGLVELAPDIHLAGCVFAARQELLRKFLFRPDLGMQADRPGYGEESEWQDRIRATGYPVHFHGDIAIDHLVRGDKQTISLRIQQAYAHGQYRARTQVPGEGKLAGFTKGTLRIVFITLPYDLARVLFRKNFYWQNGVISTAGKMAFLIGKTFGGGHLPAL